MRTILADTHILLKCREEGNQEYGKQTNRKHKGIRKPHCGLIVEAIIAAFTFARGC